MLQIHAYYLHYSGVQHTQRCLLFVNQLLQKTVKDDALLNMYLWKLTLKYIQKFVWQHRASKKNIQIFDEISKDLIVLLFSFR